jgi:hypothetical protein
MYLANTHSFLLYTPVNMHSFILCIRQRPTIQFPQRKQTVSFYLYGTQINKRKFFLNSLLEPLMGDLVKIWSGDKSTRN